MQHHNRIDVSEDIDVYKTCVSVCHYWYFLDRGIRQFTVNHTNTFIFNI